MVHNIHTNMHKCVDLDLKGAGHGGRGGHGYGQSTTGEPYGNVFEPTDFGCRGGYGNNGNTWGKGGGIIYISVSLSGAINSRL